MSTPAVVDLFDRLHGNGPRLVIFDINRRAGLEPYLRPTDAALVRSLAAPGARLYRRTLITNVSADMSEVRARSIAADTLPIEDVPMGLYWPTQMFSLSARRLAVRRRRSRLWQRAARNGDSLDRAGTPNPRGEKRGAYGAGGNVDANRLESLPAVPPRPSRRVDRSRCGQCRACAGQATHRTSICVRRALSPTDTHRTGVEALNGLTLTTESAASVSARAEAAPLMRPRSQFHVNSPSASRGDDRRASVARARPPPSVPAKSRARCSASRSMRSSSPAHLRQT